MTPLLPQLTKEVFCKNKCIEEASPWLWTYAVGQPRFINNIATFVGYHLDKNNDQVDFESNKLIWHHLPLRGLTYCWRCTEPEAYPSQALSLHSIQALHMLRDKFTTESL